MLGSARETMLILMVNCYPKEAERTGAAPTKRGNPKPLLEWTLADLLKVAKTAEWLPAGLGPQEAWSTRRARIGDHAEVLRMVRNLAHPARYIQDHFGSRVTSRYLRLHFDVVLACQDWLRERVGRSLREKINADGMS